MAENRQCYVYLPDDKKLELVLQVSVKFFYFSSYT